MSDQKAFAKFPALKPGAYQYIDIFQIEAIGQSEQPTAAVIFGATERYYQVLIPQDELDRAGEPDAASWCLSLVSKVSRAGHQATEGTDVDPDRDDEDDFETLANRA